MFFVLLALAAIASGAIASVAGFGIGSILTPLVATKTGLHVAVAAVSIPHFAATALRAWRMRTAIDKAVLLRFGIASAAGGLAGAVLQSRLQNAWLGYLLGALLVFAGLMGITGLNKKIRFGKKLGFALGILSGAFGGLVGNQGGIRSASLLGFEMSKESFVATATATGLVVDTARMPVYLVTRAHDLASVWPMLVIATLGTVIGTLAGERVLRKIPERIFSVIVSAIVLALGIYMLVS